jgi:hypothetical protein
MRYLLLVPTGSERACKTMLHTPDAQFHFISFFFSLALESFLKRRIKQRILKIPAAATLRHTVLHLPWNTCSRHALVCMI